MHVSAKADYALRALLEIADRHPEQVSLSDVIERQSLPRSFAVAILPELRRADFVRMRRHRHGVGYSLARPPAEIRVGEVLRLIDGPPVLVRGLPPEELAYGGPAANLAQLWGTAGDELDALLDRATLAGLLTGDGDGRVEVRRTAAR